jgi:hypothetical protein
MWSATAAAGSTEVLVTHLYIHRPGLPAARAARIHPARFAAGTRPVQHSTLSTAHARGIHHARGTALAGFFHYAAACAGGDLAELACPPIITAAATHAAAAMPVAVHATIVTHWHELGAAVGGGGCADTDSGGVGLPGAARCGCNSAACGGYTGDLPAAGPISSIASTNCPRGDLCCAAATTRLQWRAMPFSNPTHRGDVCLPT